MKPTAFRNTELIYSDEIGEMVAGMGFRTMLAEGAKHVLGWKSRLCQRHRPEAAPAAATTSSPTTFPLLGQWPLTVDKYVQWLSSDRLGLFDETFGGTAHGAARRIYWTKSAWNVASVFGETPGRAEPVRLR